jgi:hypothetical protein
MPLPDVYFRIIVAFLAEGHGVPMAATVTPDVEDPAFLA